MKTILIVDPNEIDGMITERMLQSYLNVNLRVINSASKAIELLVSKEVIPDVIFLETNMPIDLAKQVLSTLKKGSKISTYLTSCYHFDSDREMALSYPFVKGLIDKPISKDVILRVAEELHENLR
jgi:response regulator RpfG family c-di-GMP phosphodiesterase